MIESSFVPKLAKKARLRFDRHAKTYMIIYPERGLALNDSAAAIAKLCDGSLTVGEIVHTLCRDSDPSFAEQIVKDVHAFIDGLRQKGLLEP